MNIGMLLDTEFTGALVSDKFEGVTYSGTDFGDFTSQIYYAIAKQNKQIDKLKKLYDTLSTAMNIRPIEWLKNFNH